MNHYGIEDCAGPLFAPRVSTLSRANDRQTSRAAAASACDFVHEHERLILESLSQGPGTKDEIAQRCCLSDQQVIRRMARLERIRLVEDTGATRKTASGRMATVWRKA